MTTLDEDVARGFAEAIAENNRIRNHVLPRLEGQLKSDLEGVLAGAEQHLMQGWKIYRFDTLQSWAKGDGYHLKSDNQIFTEPPHITARLKMLREVADREIFNTGDQ